MAVAIFTEHLQVGGIGLSALYSRSDVITLHFFDCIMLLADGADAFLPFVCSPLLAICEGPDRQILLVVGKQIFVNARFLCHIIKSVH